MESLQFSAVQGRGIPSHGGNSGVKGSYIVEITIGVGCVSMR